jgi:beta-glucosidase
LCAATEPGARELRAIHLVAALAGVRAGAAGLMAAHNEFDGVPCVASHPLLTGILRERWGFGGPGDGRRAGDRPSGADGG